jgi:hypothetical protein
MRWFATDVETNNYGNGARLYRDTTLPAYVTINSMSSFKDGVLVVNAGDETVCLDCEPDHQLFRSTVHLKWAEWDRKFGAAMDEARCDYKPWSYKSLEALAAKFLGVEYDGEQFVR